MKNIFFILFACLGLTACETLTTVDYYIENRSSSSVYVTGTDLIHATPILDTIPVNAIQSIAHWQKFGKETTLFDPTSQLGNDLVIVNESGDTLQKDYRNLAAWSTVVDDQRAVATHTYHLVIEDGDF